MNEGGFCEHLASKINVSDHQAKLIFTNHLWSPTKYTATRGAFQWKSSVKSGHHSKVFSFIHQISSISKTFRDMELKVIHH